MPKKRAKRPTTGPAPRREGGASRAPSSPSQPPASASGTPEIEDVDPNGSLEAVRQRLTEFQAQQIQDLTAEIERLKALSDTQTDLIEALHAGFDRQTALIDGQAQLIRQQEEQLALLQGEDPSE